MVLASCFVTVFGVSFVCAFIILRLVWYVNNLGVNNCHKKNKINLTEVVHIATNKPCQRQHYHNTHNKAIARPPASRTVTICPRGLSGIECRSAQRVQRFGVCVVPCVVCPAACAVQSAWVRWSGQGSPAGHIAAAQPLPVSLSTTEKIKKTHPTFTKRNLSDCASLQIFRKIQKDPSRSVDCAIIS